MIIKSLEFCGSGDIEDVKISFESSRDYSSDIHSVFEHGNDVLYNLYTCINFKTPEHRRIHAEVVRTIAYLPYMENGFPNLFENKNSKGIIELIFYPDDAASMLIKYRALINKKGFISQKILQSEDGKFWDLIRESSGIEKSSILSFETFRRVTYFHTERDILGSGSNGNPISNSNVHADLYSSVVKLLSSQEFVDVMMSIFTMLKVRDPFNHQRITGIEAVNSGVIYFSTPRNDRIELSHCSEVFNKVFLFCGCIAINMFNKDNATLIIANNIDSFLTPSQLRVLYTLITGSGRPSKKPNPNSIMNKNQFVFSLSDSTNVKYVQPDEVLKQTLFDHKAIGPPAY